MGMSDKESVLRMLISLTKENKVTWGGGEISKTLRWSHGTIGNRDFISMEIYFRPERVMDRTAPWVMDCTLHTSGNSMELQKHSVVYRESKSTNDTIRALFSELRTLVLRKTYHQANKEVKKALKAISAGEAPIPTERKNPSQSEANAMARAMGCEAHHFREKTCEEVMKDSGEILLKCKIDNVKILYSHTYREW